MRHLLTAITLVALLTACGAGSSSPFTPTGKLSVTFTPVGLDPEVTVWDGRYNRIGTFQGDFTTTAPAGTVRLTATAPGYDRYNNTISVLAGETQQVTVQLVESLVASYSWASVTRYQTATMTLSGVIVKNFSGVVTLRASCVEDGYSSLTTGLRGQATVTAGEPVTAYLRHSSGFSYFTSNPVRCGIHVEAPGKQEVRVIQR